jgi:hypothetical protein
MLGKWMTDPQEQKVECRNSLCGTSKKWQVSCWYKKYTICPTIWPGMQSIGLSLMNLPDSLLQKLETEEDLNSAMAEAQVLMAVTSGPVAAAGAKQLRKERTLQNQLNI